MLPLLLKSVKYLPTLLKTQRIARGLTEKVIPHWNSSALSPLLHDSEKREILDRANWLCSQVIIEPQKLIDKMPTVIGSFYQGQWAIYACVMTTVALSNIAYLYHETNKNAISLMRQLIDMILSPEIKHYDAMKWKEDPIDSLEGNKSHMTYLSLLAFAIGHYKLTEGSDNRYDDLHHALCATLARRMKKTTHYHLPSFPNGIIFLPDMMVTPLALKIHDKIYGDKYHDLIETWKLCVKKHFIHKRTGLIVSCCYRNRRRKAPRGSYASLNCSYLAMIDKDFAKEQFQLLKKVFALQTSDGNHAAVQEYLTPIGGLKFDIDAGVIINGFSPSGTAFAIGAATILGDWQFRRQLLNTADIAGHTIRQKRLCHYQLSDIMLTGEAITLAMRTATNRY